MSLMKSLGFAGAEAEELTDWTPVVTKICCKRGYFTLKAATGRAKEPKRNGTFLDKLSANCLQPSRLHFFGVAGACLVGALGKTLGLTPCCLSFSSTAGGILFC